MTQIYIKTWDEVYRDPDTLVDPVVKYLMRHKYGPGQYNKETHGIWAGATVDADMCQDGWANAKNMWFPSLIEGFNGCP